MSDIRRQGGEALHGWTPPACLALANDRIKAEPFGPYLRCVNGSCECKKAKAEAFDPHFGDGKMASGWR